MLTAEKSKINALQIIEGDINCSSSILLWKTNQLNTCVRKFKTSSLRFSYELNVTHRTLQQRSKTQLREFDDCNELTDDDIDNITMDPKKASEYLLKKLMVVDDSMIDILEQLEQRYAGMLQLERSMQELHHLFTHLAILVSEQQEELDNIQQNVELTRSYVEQAGENLIQAEKHQKCTRKCRCCLLCGIIVIGIVLIIIFVPGLFGESF